ncbi:MAG: low molecular weight phosphotyrosine protein phosphatase [Odoribacteraceae bacterium]|jgi:protein-tyrosine phosphatase|nr:low molecular weight phosphotyrosine protein phosphatase [Odoribacteraceae bacterium]
MDKKSILFVCLGNICRSPAAEAILKRHVEERGLAGFIRVDSAGTGGWHIGELPDARMRHHAATRGYTVDSRVRRFDPATDFAAFDLIIGMDEQNIRDLRDMASTDEERAKIHRAIGYCRRFTGDTEVPDPYFDGAEGFEHVLDLLEDATGGLLDHLVGKEVVNK